MERNYNPERVLEICDHIQEIWTTSAACEDKAAYPSSIREDAYALINTITAEIINHIVKSAKK